MISEIQYLSISEMKHVIFSAWSIIVKKLATFSARSCLIDLLLFLLSLLRLFNCGTFIRRRSNYRSSYIFTHQIPIEPPPSAFTSAADHRPLLLRRRTHPHPLQGAPYIYIHIHAVSYRSGNVSNTLYLQILKGFHFEFQLTS